MLVPVKLTILGPPREVRRFSLASPVRGSALLSAAATACSCSRREISLRVTGTLLLVRSGTNEDAILPALTPPLRELRSPAGGRNTAARRSRALGMRALRRKRLRYRPTAYL